MNSERLAVQENRMGSFDLIVSCVTLPSNMSARRIDSDLFQPVTVQTQATQLNLPGNSVRLRKNGIEFRTNSPIPQWTEMVITLQTPTTPRIQCTGVVVACDGNRHGGYQVAMLFTSVSRQVQAHLDSLALSGLA